MWNSSRTWLRRENRDFAVSLPAGSLVLDAGAGDQIYRAEFAHCIYEAADFEMVDKVYAKSTYVCDLAAIPVGDERFDAIIFNQVMEHLPEPAVVLQEFRRILKPGGRMICTAPLFYEEHEQPYDFFRYTQFAWRKLMLDAGFEIERLDWMEGYYGTVSYQLKTAAKYLPYHPSKIAPGLLGWLAWPLMAGAKMLFGGLSLLFDGMDKRAKFTAAGYPKNYVCVVRKTGAATPV